MLWIVQGLLALVFLFAGGMKLVLPLEELTKDMPLPGLFLRFIGVAEVLGALGLILPGLLRIRPGLTPLAAAGLVIIMIGATVAHARRPWGASQALIPLVVGLLAAFVAYGRWRLAPLSRLLSAVGAPAGQLATRAGELARRVALGRLAGFAFPDAPDAAVASHPVHRAVTERTRGRARVSSASSSAAANERPRCAR